MCRIWGEFLKGYNKLYFSVHWRITLMLCLYMYTVQSSFLSKGSLKIMSCSNKNTCRLHGLRVSGSDTIRVSWKTRIKSLVTGEEGEDHQQSDISGRGGMVRYRKWDGKGKLFWTSLKISREFWQNSTGKTWQYQSADDHLTENSLNASYLHNQSSLRCYLALKEKKKKIGKQELNRVKTKRIENHY